MAILTSVYLFKHHPPSVSLVSLLATLKWVSRRVVLRPFLFLAFFQYDHTILACALWQSLLCTYVEQNRLPWIIMIRVYEDAWMLRYNLHFSPYLISAIMTVLLFLCQIYFKSKCCNNNSTCRLRCALCCVWQTGYQSSGSPVLFHRYVNQEASRTTASSYWFYLFATHCQPDISFCAK